MNVSTWLGARRTCDNGMEFPLAHGSHLASHRRFAQRHPRLSLGCARRRSAALSHAFLHALHESGCAAPETGWTPRYLTAWRGELLVGAMPLYVKAHSYGEYVFDWSWADAYRRHGRHYYPKLVCAVPFTPATSTTQGSVPGSK